MRFYLVFACQLHWNILLEVFLISNIFWTGYEIVNRIQVADQVIPILRTWIILYLINFLEYFYHGFACVHVYGYVCVHFYSKSVIFLSFFRKPIFIFFVIILQGTHLASYQWNIAYIRYKYTNMTGSSSSTSSISTR